MRKNRIISYSLGLGLLAIGLTAIAEENKVPPLTDAEYQTLVKSYNKGNDCVFSRSINSWTILDDKSLILYAPTKKKPYYVKLNMRSFELKFAHAIGIYSKFDNRFCPYGGNALFIDGTKYSISAIKKIDEEMAKRLIAHTKQKESEKTEGA